MSLLRLQKTRIEDNVQDISPTFGEFEYPLTSTSLVVTAHNALTRPNSVCKTDEALRTLPAFLDTMWNRLGPGIGIQVQKRRTCHRHAARQQQVFEASTNPNPSANIERPYLESRHCDCREFSCYCAQCPDKTKLCLQDG